MAEELETKVENNEETHDSNNEKTLYVFDRIKIQM